MINYWPIVITLIFDIIFNKLVVIIMCPTSNTKYLKFLIEKNDKCNLKKTIRYTKSSQSSSRFCLTRANLQYQMPDVAGSWQPSISPHHANEYQLLALSPTNYEDFRREKESFCVEEGCSKTKQNLSEISGETEHCWLSLGSGLKKGRPGLFWGDSWSTTLSFRVAPACVLACFKTG